LFCNWTIIAPCPRLSIDVGTTTSIAPASVALLGS
jgi:hypothetical protein